MSIKIRSLSISMLLATVTWAAPSAHLALARERAMSLGGSAAGISGPETLQDSGLQEPQEEKKPKTAKPDTQTQRERLEQSGTTNPNLQTEREKHSIPAPGQTPAQTPPSEVPSAAFAPGQDLETIINRPVPLTPPVGHARVGVDLSKVNYLTLQDAIRMALQNNLDIEQFRQGVQISQYALFSARGVYDLTSGSTINFRDQTIPVASIFAGGSANSTVNQKIFTYDFTTGRQVERTGANWTVEWDNNRTATSSTAATLVTQYAPTLQLSVTQPLMRNLAVDANRHTIRIAKAQLDLSDSQFRQRVIEIINQVQDAYWELVFAIRNEKIARDTVALAETQLETNQQQVNAGTMAPIDLRSTEAQIEANKGNVITAMQTITTDENALKVLLVKDPADPLWGQVMQPTDEPQFNLPTYSLDEAVRLAINNRPELQQIKLQALQNQFDIEYYKNQTKPQLDLVGFVNTTGLAGTPSTLVRSPGGFSLFDTKLINKLNNALNTLNLPLFNPQPPGAQVVGSSAPPQFVGGYFTSLSQLFSINYPSWQVGVQFSIPWRNRTAEGNLGRALALARQTDAKQRQLMMQIQVDVRNSLQAVEAARESYDAAVANRAAAEAQLAGEMEKFRAGLSTNFLVLQRQTDLATARGSEVRALTNYNKAVSDLQRVTGLTLVSNNVQEPSSTDNSSSGGPQGGPPNPGK